MKPTILIFLAALAASPATVESGPRKSLAFDVAEGTVLSKTFQETTRWSLDEFQQLYDGNDMATEVEDMGVETDVQIEVRDEYGETEGGRPSRIERSVETAEAEAATWIEIIDDSEEYEVALKSPVADATLVIEWNPRDKAYDITTEDEVSEARLDGLVEDMDFRCLLPREEVAEGDSWKIDASELEPMLAPGGDWALLPEEMPDGYYEILAPEDLLASISAVLANPREGISGEADLSWKQTRESDGKRLAVIEIELEASMTCDLAERIQEMAERAGYAWTRRDTRYLLDWELEGKGELLWDLDAGHFASYSFEAKSDLAVELTWTVDMGSTQAEFAIMADLAATTALEASAVVAE